MGRAGKPGMKGQGSEIAFSDAILRCAEFPKVHFVYGWSAQGRVGSTEFGNEFRWLHFRA